MASAGTGYFDHAGHFHKTPEEATLRDLAEVLGRVGEREGLAAGIAQILLDRRYDIEKIYFEHDAMLALSAHEPASDIRDQKKFENSEERISVFPTHG